MQIYIILAGFVGVLAVVAGLSVLLVKYGKKIAEGESKDATLQTEIKMHEVAKDVLASQPVTDDDVLDRLSGKS